MYADCVFVDKNRRWTINRLPKFSRGLQHQIFQIFVLKFQFDFEEMFLDLVPVVRTEGQFIFEHVDDLVLVLLVDAKGPTRCRRSILVDDATSQAHCLL